MSQLPENLDNDANGVEAKASTSATAFRAMVTR